MARNAAITLFVLLAVGVLCGLSWAAEIGALVDSTASNTATGPDAISPCEPSAVATIYCIGVMWPVEGDADGSAACAVAFREAGTQEWTKAMPLYRKAPATYIPPVSSRGSRPAGAPSIDSTRPAAAQPPQYGSHSDDSYISQHMAANYLAGSIFNLKPGTAYEVDLMLTDPNSGYSSEKMLKVTTRTEPVLPPATTKIDVTAEGGAKALSAALTAAKPGDTIVVHKGTYQGPFKLSASGTAEKPIVIRAAGDGAAVIVGEGYEKTYEGESSHICLQIDGSHVFVDGIELETAVTAINIGPGRFNSKAQWDKLQASGAMQSDIVITHCTTRATQYGITGTANNCYVADNDFTGLAADTEGIDWSEGEGVEIHGSGTVICYNRMHHVADMVSIYSFTSNQDVYNNDSYADSDDGIELDYSDANNRVWDNRFWYPANNGVSFQPYMGGPAYIIRNEVIGPNENSSKDRNNSRDVFFINNTFVGHKPNPAMGKNSVLSYFDMPLHCVSRNNLYLIQEATDLPAVNVHPEDVTNHTLNMDYDGIGGIFIMRNRNGGKDVDPAKYPGSHYVASNGLYIPVDSIRRAAGTLEHWTPVDPAKLFEKPLPATHEWRVETPRELMLLREGSNAIDAGTVMPTVTDGYAGKAPDLGAHEFGRPAPHYGPRPR